MYIIVGIAFLLFIFGILIKYFKAYWLISGYNTASLEHKRKVDIAGLGKFVGESCFVIGLFMLVLAGLIHRGYAVASVFGWPLLCVYIMYILVKAQSFDPTTRTADGRMTFQVKVLVWAVSALLLVVLGGLAYGSMPPQIRVTSNQVEIGGIYASQIQMDHIQELSLKNSIPKVVKKTNGFDMGNILKGNFILQDIGHVKLYAHVGRPPYVYILTDEGYVIINYGDARKTQDLYDMIQGYK
jgi:hypothetical protein